MEFLTVFVLTLIVLVGLVLLLQFGRVPTYRPSRQTVRELLAGVLECSTRREAWELFLGLPILHDEGLEQIRRACVLIHEGDGEHPAANEGLSGYLYDRAGRERIAAVLAELDRMIATDPVYREF